jgi:Leucine-rich repeat (LRR) protein
MIEENFDIEEYINSLPDDIENIELSFINLTYIPDLSRFKKLKKLYCISNKLTYLPNLSNSLTILACSNNKLTYLPDLLIVFINSNCRSKYTCKLHH